MQQQPYIQISQTLIHDLKLTLQYMLSTYSFTNIQIIQNYPRLTFDNKYNKHFPVLDIQAYDSQIQLIQQVRNNIDAQKGQIISGSTILYNTMVGTGKSTVVIALAQMIHTINNIRKCKGGKRLKLIYACQINSVISQLVHLCYKKDINLGFSFKVTIKRNQKQWSYPQIYQLFNVHGQFDLIISNWQNTYMMLDKHQYTQQYITIFQNQLRVNHNYKKLSITKFNQEDVILFIDQPNFACNASGFEKNKVLFQILGNRPPKIIVLASATLPTKDQIPKTLEMIKMHHQKLKIKQILSKEFQIGCQFCTFKGQIFYPHTSVKNKAQLLNIIKRIQQNPFLMRLYSGKSILSLIKKLKDNNILLTTQLNIQQINFSSKNYPKLAIQILTNLFEYQDQIIENICKLDQQDSIQNHEQKVDQYQHLFQFIKTTKDKQQNYLNFKKIFKEDAYKFLGGCLIFAENPIEFAKNNLRQWVSDIPSLKKLFKFGPYKDLYEQQIELQLIRGRAEQQKAMLPHQSNNKNFPSHKKINTIHHYQYYTRDLKLCSIQNKLNYSKLSNVIDLQQIQQLFLSNQVDQFLIRLLICGVGVYTQKNIPRSYLEKLQQFAHLKKLAFIISDRALLFGTNFPITNVILFDNLANQLELNQIFQLVGRAGRVGKSWTARAFLQQDTIKRLLQFTQGDKNKAGIQAQIFQLNAINIMKNPELKLRTKATQISKNLDPMYKFKQEPIKIIINPYSQPCYIKRISLILISKDNQFVSNKIGYNLISKYNKQISIQQYYYQFTNYPLLLQDLPKKNYVDEHGETETIDIQKYYHNQQKYICQIFSNIVKRMLNSLQVKIINNFSLDKFREYYENVEQTYCIVAECENNLTHQQIYIQSQKYMFNQIKIQQNLLPQYSCQKKILNKINKINKHLRSLTYTLYKNPFSIISSSFIPIKQLLTQINNQEYSFYRQLYKQFKSRIDIQFQQIFKEVQNKQSLLYEKEIKMIIFSNFIPSFDKIGTPLGRIDSRICQIKYIRDIFMNLTANNNEEYIQEQNPPHSIIQLQHQKDQNYLDSWQAQLIQRFQKLQQLQ